MTRHQLLSQLLNQVRSAKLDLSYRHCALLALPPSSRREGAVLRNRSDWSVVGDLERCLVITLGDEHSTSIFPDGAALLYRLTSGQWWARMPNGTWVCVGEDDGAIRTTPGTLKTDFETQYDLHNRAVLER